MKNSPWDTSREQAKANERIVGIFETFTEDERAEVLFLVGQMMMRLPILARTCGHGNPINTYRDYMQVSDDMSKVERAAAEYMHDFFSADGRKKHRRKQMKAPALFYKWFGGSPYGWSAHGSFITRKGGLLDDDKTR